MDAQREKMIAFAASRLVVEEAVKLVLRLRGRSGPTAPAVVTPPAYAT